jgi:hypothetical protein
VAYDKTLQDAIDRTCADVAAEMCCSPQDVLTSAVAHYAAAVDWCRIYLVQNGGEIRGKPVLMMDVSDMLMRLRQMQEEPTVRISLPDQEPDKDTVH